MEPQEQRSPQTTQADTPPSPEEKPRAASIPIWRGRDLWLRVLGVAVALAGGVVCSLPTADPMAVYLALPFLVGAVSAALLRSWWTILIVPVAFRVGFLLAGIPLAGAFDSVALSSADATVEVLATLYGLQLVPVAIGIAIGVPTGKALEQRLRQQTLTSRALSSLLS